MPGLETNLKIPRPRPSTQAETETRPRPQKVGLETFIAGCTYHTHFIFYTLLLHDIASSYSKYSIGSKKVLPH